MQNKYLKGNVTLQWMLDNPPEMEDSDSGAVSSATVVGEIEHYTFR